jgi:hypothetical protein
MDKWSGHIVVKEQLDYEKIPVYNLMVRARDKGFYSKSSTAAVKIILQDVDDNPPTFDKVKQKSSFRQRIFFYRAKPIYNLEFTFTIKPCYVKIQFSVAIIAKIAFTYVKRGKLHSFVKSYRNHILL